MRALIAIALACCAGLGYAASEPPVPSPAKAASQPKTETGQQEKQADTDKRGTKASPLVIDIGQSSVIKIETADKTEKRHDYTAGEWWLVYLTAALVVVTFGLALYTALLYRQTKRLATDAEEATTRQASETKDSLAISQKAADAAEQTVAHMQTNAAKELRAYVLVKNVRIVSERSLLSAEKEPHLSISFFNFGKIPAKDLRLRYTIQPGQPLLRQAPTLDPSFEECMAGVLAPGDFFTMRFRLKNVNLEFVATENTLHVFGHLTYHDGFIAGRLTNFRYKRIGQDWDSIGEFDIGDGGNDYT